MTYSALRKANGPADQTVNHPNCQVYHRHKAVTNFLPSETHKITKTPSLMKFGRDLLWIREVVVDLLVQNVENHVQKVPEHTKDRFVISIPHTELVDKKFYQSR